jgi:rhodanese-related sulfurtransferase
MTRSLGPFELSQWRRERPDVRVIDVRTPGEFAVRHIPGSYNVPLPDLPGHRSELAAVVGSVVLVCQSGRRSVEAESRLEDAHLDDVHVLAGGLHAWEAAGLPVASTDSHGTRWTLERQVRLAAGGIVAVATAISVVYPPVRFLAGLVGAGLVGAAVTDSCAMGSLLARLPYNRASSSAGCDMSTVVAQLTDRTGVAS